MAKTTLNCDFLGSINFSSSVYYMDDSLDSEEAFLKNKESLTEDWYYYDKPVEYSFNEFGHRSKSVKDLDLTDYVLFSGDSHTHGTGLHLEDTYSYIVAKHLQKDYYNLAYDAFGPDAVFYNTLLWLNKYNKPKRLLFQVPYPNRYLTQTDEGEILLEGPWSINDQMKLLKVAHSLNYLSTRYRLSLNLLRSKCEQLDVPITYISFRNRNGVEQYNTFTVSDIDDFVFAKKEDVSRDMTHYGSITNRNLAQDIIKKITGDNTGNNIYG